MESGCGGILGSRCRASPHRGPRAVKRRSPSPGCPTYLPWSGATAHPVPARPPAPALTASSRNPGPDTADTLVLVVRELVNNAWRHGGGHSPRERLPRRHRGSRRRHQSMLAAHAYPRPERCSRPVVNRLSRTTTITRRAASDKTITTFLPRCRPREQRELMATPSAPERTPTGRRVPGHAPACEGCLFVPEGGS